MENNCLKKYSDFYFKDSFCDSRKNNLKEFENLIDKFKTLESWKYSNVKDYLPQISIEDESLEIEYQEIISKRLLSQENPLVVIYNGQFKEYIPAKENLSAITISNDSNFNKSYNINDKRYFSYLTSSLSLEKVSIEVEANADILKPIELLFINNFKTCNFILPLIDISVGENSKVNFIETFVDLNSENGSVISEINFNCKSGSLVNHNRINNFSNNSSLCIYLNANIDTKANFKSFNLNLNGKKIRNEYQINHNEIDSDSSFYTLNILNNDQTVDNITEVNHKVPTCLSNQLIKGIYTDKSKGVFDGKITVSQDAQKINAIQSSKSLILSENAKSYFKPQLQIWADDVKCTHGATSGEISEEALFYLMSRGIDRSTARKLLITSFCQDIFTDIENDQIKFVFEREVNNKLNNNFNF